MVLIVVILMKVIVVIRMVRIVVIIIVIIVVTMIWCYMWACLCFPLFPADALTAEQTEVCCLAFLPGSLRQLRLLWQVRFALVLALCAVLGRLEPRCQVSPETGRAMESW